MAGEEEDRAGQVHFAGRLPALHIKHIALVNKLRAPLLSVRQNLSLLLWMTMNWKAKHLFNWCISKKIHPEQRVLGFKFLRVRSMGCLYTWAMYLEFHCQPKRRWPMKSYDSCEQVCVSFKFSFTLCLSFHERERERAMKVRKKNNFFGF